MCEGYVAMIRAISYVVITSKKVVKANVASYASLLDLLLALFCVCDTLHMARANTHLVLPFSFHMLFIYPLPPQYLVHCTLHQHGSLLL